MSLVHHHLIYQAKTGVRFGENSEVILRKFLYELLKVIGMQCLIPARLKFSHQKAWTGLMGIVTSHVAFHYWVEEGYIQLDIYSCKAFDRAKAVGFLNNFWKSFGVKTLFIDRKIDEEFEVDVDKPLAYKRGYQKFYGRKFKVDERAYIPNKETEQLVRVFLFEVKRDNAVVLDVGTGAGALAVTIKKEKPEFVVYASDINQEALEVTRENGKKHQVDIFYLKSSYVDNLNIPEPTYIIADLPWGNKDFLLASNSLKKFSYMPKDSYFHPQGKLVAYKELIVSILKRNWKSRLFIESGLITQKEISSIVPKDLKWEYKQFKNYSVTVVQF